VWLGGLNILAAQQASEGEALQQSIHDRVARAFPELPLIMDPLKQAQQRVDALRASRSVAGDADFMPLAQAAARLLPAGGFEVSALSYQDGVLSIDTNDNSHTAPATHSGTQHPAVTQRLLLAPTDTGWKIAPARLADRADASDHAPNAEEPRP
jgi:general secretion pathway protein L